MMQYQSILNIGTLVTGVCVVYILQDWEAHGHLHFAPYVVLLSCMLIFFILILLFMISSATVKQENCILEQLMRLVNGQLSQLWKLSPALVAVSIPSW